jgi:pimeloyl-ACP methyl ester carboxylesterase
MSDLLSREIGFLERDGERLYYESVGNGDALVLCHGAGGNHAVWFQQVPFFARSRRVITWDHRGFGRSTARGGPTTPALAAENLGALLDHLGVGRADLVGQSLGGWTVLRFALDQPSRVRRLVLSNTPGGIETPELREAWQSQLASVGFGRPTLGAHPALAPDFAEEDPARAYLYQMLGGFGEPDLAKIAPSLLTTSVGRPELAGLACPALFTTGPHDGLFPPPLIRATAALVPGARVEEIAGAGHSPYFERPDLWNRVVADFLA